MNTSTPDCVMCKQPTTEATACPVVGGGFVHFACADQKALSARGRRAGIAAICVCITWLATVVYVASTRNTTTGLTLALLAALLLADLHWVAWRGIAYRALLMLRLVARQVRP